MTATDGYDSIVQSVYIQVYNRAPYYNYPVNLMDNKEAPLEVHIYKQVDFFIPQRTFVDLDGDELKYSLQMKDTSKPLPIWVNFNAGSRRLHGIP